MVLGVGAASAIFVDYLADRALARAGDAPPASDATLVAKSTGAELTADASMDMPDTAVVASDVEPVTPVKTEIVAALPAADAAAKVAADVGPEHAIELPTDDPTAKPVLHLDEVSAAQADASLGADDEGADDTLTAAISQSESAFAEQDEATEPEPAPVKPKRQAKAARQKTVAPDNTEVASLPGVDIGGLAGNPSDDNDNSDSKVRTVTKPGNAASTKGAVSGSARVTQAVNLRSSPKKGSSVAMVVPAGSSVKVLSCDGWCQVSFNGKKGWVYGSFLSSAKPQKAAKSASAAAPAAARKVSSSRL